MANKWLMHVKKTMKTMKSRGTYKKGDGLKKVILEAKKSYKKHKGGEGTDSSSSDSSAPKAEAKPENPPAMGGRKHKRGTRRTHRNRK